mmetsp:Transcript_30952/g.44469  ORF Transcript_30952/g.44469 Transcript_30952/m.44469 type:complete len:84 (-) Transcript_30952:2069-2320(-)
MRYKALLISSNETGRDGTFTVTSTVGFDSAVFCAGVGDAVAAVVTEAEDGYAAGLNVDDGHAVVARNNDNGAPLRACDRKEVD